VKDRILDILRFETGVVSGARLGSELNTSRVSIWKHIRQLQDLGYVITATPKGYRLDEEPDALFPWAFGRWQDYIHFFEETDSTMSVARDLARNGSPEYTVVIAEKQLKGRGRLDRQWHSGAGGLYFTLILRPQLPPNQVFRINFAAALALVHSLKQLFEIEAKVKWPNDVLIDNKKVAGMLSEFEADSDRLQYVNLGLGINVNNDIRPFNKSAVSLKQLIGQPVARKKVLLAFLTNMEALLDERRLEEIVSLWKQCTATLGRQVRVVTRQAEFSGRAVDIDADGALILAQADGRSTAVHYGDCFHEE
jgi:BirA family biotin operon repressor/biotin-[acetyl-CoA-carboxylase] ligase